ncbi:MAG: DUF4232 domain-containing protein, partial [Acidimicrobiales bacterium]
MRLRPLTAAPIAAVLGVVLPLAGCSANPTVPSSSPPSSAPRPSTTTTRATSVRNCQPSDLKIDVSGSGGAAGTIELTFSLVNSGSVSCTMEGYPGMLLLDAKGAPLPTTVVRGGSLSFDDLAVTSVSLAPGESSFFNAGYSDVSGTGTCSVASQVEITPPNDTAHAVLPVTGLDACENGMLTVSPVFASSNVTDTQTTAPP